MPRVIKESAVRRSEILDAAQMLVYTKGYEQMTIQDILDKLSISKGAFYHYFNSKQALLEALIERLAEEAEKMMLPILKDPHLPALQKLEAFFINTGRWKTNQKAYLLSLLRVWYSDDNAIVREKMLNTMVKRFAPLLADVIRQGAEEGVLSSRYPDSVAEVMIYLIRSLGDTFMEPLLAERPRAGDFQKVQTALAAYTDALERVLGAPQGSLHLMDQATLAEWIPPPANTIQNDSANLR
jgi:AcrR family transcriptional regulator